MQRAAIVAVLQRRRELREPLARAGQRQLLPLLLQQLQVRLQVTALAVGKHHVQEIILDEAILARNNVRMFDGLRREAHLVGVGVAGGDLLEYYVAARLCVDGQVGHALRPIAELLNYSVTAHFGLFFSPALYLCTPEFI